MTGERGEPLGRAPAGVGFFVLDTIGKLLRASAGACELMGRGEQQLLGTPLSELVDPEDRTWATVELGLLSALREPFSCEFRLQGGDGRAVWTRLSGRPVGRWTAAAVGSVVMIENARAVHERRHADRGIDQLTGLRDRRAFMIDLERELTLVERYHGLAALLVLRFEGLEEIRRTHGEAAAEAAVRASAALFRSRVRASDLNGRVGVDEFAVLLHAADMSEAAVVAGSLLGATRAGGGARDRKAIKVSIGIALTGQSASTPADLYCQARLALRETRRSGADGYSVARGLNGDRTPDPFDRRRGVPVRPSGSRAPSGGQTDTSAAPIDVMRLLLVVDRLGTTSLPALAWGMYVPERAVMPAWSRAVREGLLRRARYDKTARAWLYTLSPIARGRLRAAAREDQRQPDPSPPSRRRASRSSHSS